jgi:hypothetical protein
MKQNSSTRRRARCGTQEPPPPQWFCDEELKPLWQVNARLMEALVARNGTGPLPCSLSSDVRERLRDLGDSGRQRLVQLPCLLVDGGFHDVQQWLSAEAALNEGIVTGAAGGWSQSVTGITLARETLHLAWYWSRTYADAVQGVLGASRPCAAMIAKLDLLSLDTLASTYGDWFRVRWEDRPGFWRTLIALVQNEPESPPFPIDVVGLRRFSEWMLGSSAA